MAINPKIVRKIKSKTSDNSEKRRLLISFLSRVEEGKQPKREIDKIMKEIKTI
ncbi:MAG: hypothetical protein KBT06_10160 [Prevotellaceae bacterium]|nr:hypothetical protein [Candidatus Colivivens equi]